MSIAGVVCEYNPFHAGHAYHLKATRAAGAQAVVCVMSGHFVQRAEPALLTKWTRAQAAVLGGADLVIELPTASALRSAEGFWTWISAMYFRTLVARSRPVSMSKSSGVSSMNLVWHLPA